MSLRLSTGAPFGLLRAHVRGGAEDHAQPVVIAGDVIVGDWRARPATAGRRLQRLREAEVQHLHRAVRPHLDVRRLQIAMNDALLVRRFERLGDLLRDRQRLVERDRPARDALRQSPRPRRAPSRAHGRRRTPRGRRSCAMLRMIQRGEDLRFALKPREPFGVARERRRAGP